MTSFRVIWLNWFLCYLHANGAILGKETKNPASPRYSYLPVKTGENNEFPQNPISPAFLKTLRPIPPNIPDVGTIVYSSWAEVLH